MRYAFGECILDTDTRQVSRAGRPMHLGPKAYDLLHVLMAARPKVLTKFDLFERVWPGTSVSESSLSTVIAELRDALGDPAREARYIRTAYGVGYAFTARVMVLDDVVTPAPIAQTSRFWLVWGRREFELTIGVHLAGRARDAQISIDDPAVSRYHARVVVSPAGVATVEDLGSRNGTFLNQQRLATIAPLHDGDTVSIGPIQLVVSVRPAEGTATIPALTHHVSDTAE
jgi:DNA-binding winged helix-turn-helix (wHTH) protein